VIVIPAIDLRAGRCVRLVQGDFSRARVYDGDPERIAQEWRARGAQWLHVVDLDGAVRGYPAQLELVASLVAAVPEVQVQLGGGLRSLEDVDLALAMGVARVVLGTAAIESPNLLKSAIERYGPDRIVLGVDARGGRVAVRGWHQVTDLPVDVVIEAAKQDGIRRIVYTDIERDGTLTAPNFDAVAALGRHGVALIASGGIASRDHLRQLAQLPQVEAAIVGRALYDGTLDLTGPQDWRIEPTTTAGAG